MELWPLSSDQNINKFGCIYYTWKPDGSESAKTVAYTPTYSLSAIYYNLSVFELLTFGHLKKIAKGFEIS